MPSRQTHQERGRYERQGRKIRGRRSFRRSRGGGWVKQLMPSRTTRPPWRLRRSTPDGLPNVRMVLLKEIEDNSFVFYTNYGQRQGTGTEGSTPKAGFRHPLEIPSPPNPGARNLVTVEDGAQADEYYASRASQKPDWRLGVPPVATSGKSREHLMAEAAKMGLKHGMNPEASSVLGRFPHHTRRNRVLGRW